MNNPLILALPSKGRLQEQCETILTSAGLVLERRGGRNYRARIAGRENVEVAFLSASEIAQQLAAGAVHLGITGEDLVRETVVDADRKVALLAPLGFGHADLVVAVPELWIDVWTMEDLDDVAAGFRARHGRRLRIATKYWNLTQGFFAQHGVAVYRVVESLGATEGAPASGTADAIVDITTSGSTLAANHLKVLEDGVILRSQANLALSLTAVWDRSSKQVAADLIEALEGSGARVRRKVVAAWLARK